jgi:hypothetical protein
MIIPIPDHRKEMPYISIEHYYTDSEIRTLDKNGRRLFIAYEFNADGKYYNGDNIWSLNVNKSTRQNKIIDEKVYKLKHTCDKKEEVATEKDKASIALSKNDFVGYLVRGQNPFNDISIECFSLIFEIIAEICNKPTFVKDPAKQISNGVYLEQLDNGFKELMIEVAMERNKAIKLQGNSLYSYNLDVTDSKEYVNFSIFTEDNESLGHIPISVSDDLISFFTDKLSNKYNRVYLHIYDDEYKVHITHFEIMSDDFALFFINKILKKLR